MIAKGNLHAHGVNLAKYLITTGHGDLLAELIELRGCAAATNIRDAFIDVQIQAEATRATKPFFHSYVRLPACDAGKLTNEDWLVFADRLESALGFDGQSRAIAFHHKANGDTHMHIGWSRIDLASLTAIDPGLYKNKMKQLCRAFEKEFGLTEVANERGADVKTKSANRPEFEQSRRLGTDLKAIRNTIHDCWHSADSGQAFAAALAEHGLILAKGDRRDYVIIDRNGGDHALSKRITGATAPETRQRMADIDRATLPSVDDAKAMQRERPAPEPRPAQKMAEAEGIRSNPAVELTDKDFADQEARKLDQIEKLKAHDAQLQAYKESVQKNAEAAERQRQTLEDKEAAQRKSGEISDPSVRYAIALSHNYNVKDPYATLAGAALSEGAMFKKEQEAFRKEAAAEQDPVKRGQIELRAKIEAADYMALTTERMAKIGAVIAGRNDHPDVQHDRKRAAQYREMATELRQQRQDQDESTKRQERELMASQLGGLAKDVDKGAMSAKEEKLAKVRQGNMEAEKAAEGKAQTPGKGRGGRA